MPIFYNPQNSSSNVLQTSNQYFPNYNDTNKLLISLEPLSIYPGGNNIGWELNNMQTGNTKNHGEGYNVSPMTRRGYLVFDNKNTSFNSFKGWQLGGQIPNETAPVVRPQVIKGNIPFIKSNENERTVGIQIKTPGIYDMQIIRKYVNDNMQHGGNGTIENLNYKKYIYILIFKSGTTFDRIKTYFHDNRKQLIDSDGDVPINQGGVRHVPSRAVFPYDSMFKYTPTPGNYCNAILNIDDIVMVYSTKRIATIIFSGVRKKEIYGYNIY